MGLNGLRYLLKIFKDRVEKCPKTKIIMSKVDKNLDHRTPGNYRIFGTGARPPEGAKGTHVGFIVPMLPLKSRLINWPPFELGYLI